MQNKGLLFIPDISGFTRFVNESEIDHSRLIIQELLEILINANNLDLKISEIEGDAILFYKFGEPPSLQELYKQVEKMFVEFHRNIHAYQQRRYCQCKACISVADLTLKVVTHYGEFTGYNVKSFNKLIGKDIIVAHQLLKNDIPLHEYWLVTSNLIQGEKPAGLTGWMHWEQSIKHTDTGEIPFQYTQLGELKNGITPEPLVQPDFDKMVKIFSSEREYDTDIITLFHATGDFKYRYRWQHGVQAVEELNHYLPRMGMKCRCLTDDGEFIICSNGFDYQETKIRFNETDEFKKTGTMFTLERTGHKKTKLTLDFYLRANPLAQVMFNLTRKRKVEEGFKKSMENLVGLVKELRIPTAAIT